MPTLKKTFCRLCEVNCGLEAEVDDDGVVRIVIAGEDVGHPNWLDTAGHARGALALRWVGAREVPEPRTRVVKLDPL